VRRVGRSPWVLPVAVVAIGVLVVVVFPTRTFLAQRASMRAAEEQLEVLDEQNRLLEERVRLLNDDAEIERLAREEYHLVRPGEEAYAVLPPPMPAAPPPAVGTAPRADDRNPLEQAWDWLTDRF
jgi:cell division protein FtsB